MNQQLALAAATLITMIALAILVRLLRASRQISIAIFAVGLGLSFAAAPFYADVDVRMALPTGLLLVSIGVTGLAVWKNAYKMAAVLLAISSLILLAMPAALGTSWSYAAICILGGPVPMAVVVVARFRATATRAEDK